MITMFLLKPFLNRLFWALFLVLGPDWAGWRTNRFSIPSQIGVNKNRKQSWLSIDEVKRWKLSRPFRSRDPESVQFRSCPWQSGKSPWFSSQECQRGALLSCLLDELSEATQDNKTPIQTPSFWWISEFSSCSWWTWILSVKFSPSLRDFRDLEAIEVTRAVLRPIKKQIEDMAFWPAPHRTCQHATVLSWEWIHPDLPIPQTILADSPKAMLRRRQGWDNHCLNETMCFSLPEIPYSVQRLVELPPGCTATPLSYGPPTFLILFSLFLSDTDQRLHTFSLIILLGIIPSLFLEACLPLHHVATYRGHGLLDSSPVSPWQLPRLTANHPYFSLISKFFC